MIHWRHITPIGRTSLTNDIIRRLISLIVDEGREPGDKLPSGREIIV